MNFDKPDPYNIENMRKIYGDIAKFLEGETREEAQEKDAQCRELDSRNHQEGMWSAAEILRDRGPDVLREFLLPEASPLMAIESLVELIEQKERRRK